MLLRAEQKKVKPGNDKATLFLKVRTLLFFLEKLAFAYSLYVSDDNGVHIHEEGTKLVTLSFRKSLITSFRAHSSGVTERGNVPKHTYIH